tara:strand:- start:3517 stop:3933 length:417 start_codon:yes stop_codon:yes gene_type:complete
MSEDQNLNNGEVIAFITCDDVYVDPATGKHSLLGIFTNLRGRNFPVRHPKMIWYVSLGEVPQGTHNFKIYFGVIPSEEPPELIIDKEITSEGAHKKINMINEIKDLVIEESNSYSIIIEVDEDVLFVDTFDVQQVDDE